MLQNYIKIAFRNFLKFKGYAAINIFGLAIGLACALLILQHLRHELQHDQHHVQLDRLYRVGTTFNTGDKESKTAVGPSPLAWTLVHDFPEVESAARLLKAPGTEQYLVKYGDRSFFEKDGIFADSTFFRILKFDFVEGDPQNALNEPYNVVISKKMADKIFGEEKALNKTIKISDQWGENEFKVTGVIDRSTFPTHVTSNFFINLRSGAVGQYFYALNEWAGNNMFYTYIKLSPNANPQTLAAKFPDLVEEKAGDRLRTLGFEKAHYLQAVKDIYLKSNVDYEIGPVGDMSFVYIFAAIALFILLIACINFMNLSTAKATIRAQEVGVRKVIGANRTMLSGQFLTEAFIYTSLAMIAAGILAKIALPFFNRLANKDLDLGIFSDGVLLLWIFGILLFTSLLAGSYPALYLSSFSPANIFSGAAGSRFSAKKVRKALVVIQFIVSIALIQGVFVIQEQMNYLRDKKLGFEPEAKLVVSLNTSNAASKYKVLKESFLQNSQVNAIGGTSSTPGMPNVEDMLVFGEGQSQENSSHTMRYWIDPGYLSMMDFELLKGRFFDNTRLADTIRSAVITEKLMKNLGYKVDNAIGKKVQWNWDGNLNTHEIIGVISDFHAGSLRQEVDSHLFIWSLNDSPRAMVASVATNKLSDLLTDLNDRWSAVNPSEPFEYFFLNDKLQQAYQTDQRLAKLIFAFTLLAIIISCLGLFGLAAFAAESRMKEISVRKVLGATTGNIVSLLSKDFLYMVMLALVIATPVAIYFLNEWLQGFYYRITMPWWSFIVAGLMAMFIAFLTVSFQGVKAALVNPAERLKSE